MAGTQDLDTGQFLTYLFILFLPFITLFLIHQVIPHDPIKFKILQWAVIQGQPWALRGTCRPLSRKKFKRYKMPSVSMVHGEVKTSNILLTYLIPLAMAAFRVGCRMKCFLHQLGHLGRPPNHFAAMAGKVGAHLDPYLRFDSDSFWIGVNNHASFCMANSPHLFEDLHLTEQGTQVQGIGVGLQVKGTGTFVMRIHDGDGKTHEIKIPKSLYLPNLKGCLLPPQHWVQEAKAKKGNKGLTWMENYWDKCILIWDGGKSWRSIPHSPLTNTSTFYSSPASKMYHAFAATFKACEAAFLNREQVLQVPGLRERVPEEFIAEENIHLRPGNYLEVKKMREDNAQCEREGG